MSDLSNEVAGQLDKAADKVKVFAELEPATGNLIIAIAAFAEQAILYFGPKLFAKVFPNVTLPIPAAK